MSYNQNQIPIAVERHCKLDLPASHASTQSFMLLQPLYYKHCIKTENHHFNFTSVVNPMPMPVPTFGRIRHNLRHFFVPYRLVFPNWEEFHNDVIANNVDYSSQVSSLPNFTPSALLSLFTNHADLTTQVPSGTGDFEFSGYGYQFTRLGSYFYKILYSLGYDLVGNDKTPFFNALALLCYARVYSDWYANSQYRNSSDFLALQRYFKFNDPTSSLNLSDADLYRILMFVRPSIYQSNTYFEDAWDNPVAPNSGQFTNFTFTDPTSSSGITIGTNVDGTPEMYQANNTDLSIGTQYIHTALQKLSAYQRRHALAGALAIDRVLADYGIQTDNLRQQRSIYIGCTQNDVEINTIFASANGQNSLGQSVVGDKAGAALGKGTSTLDFQNDEDGLFITISTIQPSGGYYQGYDRHNRHLSKSQFYTAAFDSLGVQAIERGEVYVSKDLDNFAPNGASDYARLFGYTGRYGEYKRSIDRVSGDLALPRRLAGGHCWHLMREFTDNYFGGFVGNISHDEDFCRGTDALTYNRIFTYTSQDETLDPFYVFLQTQCASYAPCHPLTDSFDWDTDAPNVKISTNGPKVN